MVIFSVDYGDARTGMAVCDKNEILSSPLGVIHETWMPKVINALKEKIESSGADLVVVGNPVNMDGTKGERSAKCSELAQELEKATGIKTVMWDERLTTVSAHKALNVVDVRGNKRKNVVDAVSAVMILDDYISFRKNNK